MAEMLIEKEHCARSSNSNTHRITRSDCEDQDLKAHIQSNTPTLSPELNSNDGLTDNADVSAVVGKAKKAAQFLWILIHAQNCNIGGDRCPHKACVEAKRMLLHIKTCKAETCAQPCPSGYNWCHQARKLLSHYQKCREVRAKQAGFGRRPKNQNVPACLVCSLVARHARNVLEIPSRKSICKKPVITSFTIAKNPDLDTRDNNRKSQSTMPPPPPRQRINRNRSLSSSMDLSSSEKMTSNESRGNMNDLMLFSQVAAAATPPQNGNSFDRSVLINNKRSSYLTFAASALQDLRRSSPSAEDAKEKSEVQCGSMRRLRAESYDERVLKQRQERSDHVDPTLELDLKGEQDIGPKVVVGGENIVRRARSASLGILASACVNHERINCDTIVEESTDIR